MLDRFDVDLAARPHVLYDVGRVWRADPYHPPVRTAATLPLYATRWASAA